MHGSRYRADRIPDEGIRGDFSVHDNRLREPRWEVL